MKAHYASRAAATLVMLLSVCAQAAETERSKAVSDPPTVSAEDLAAIGERIRQTGAQIRADIKEARARLDAQKAQEEAERKRDAEQARLQAIRESKNRQAAEAAQTRARQEAAAQAEQAAREHQESLRAQRQQAEKAKREEQLALAAQSAKAEQVARRQTAKEKAAEALSQARASAGVRAFAEEPGR